MTQTGSSQANLSTLARLILELRADPRRWIESTLQIRTKDRRVIPLHFNPAQVDYWQHRTARDVILKPRQLGFTTIVSAMYFSDTVLRPNTTSVLLAHDLGSTQQLFEIPKLFWARLPASEKRRVGRPKYSNRRELFWPRINSRFFVGTAGATRFGRGFTINNLHCSEYAFWDHPEDSLLAAVEAVPQDGRIVIESTANGVGNAFHDLWLAAVDRRSEFAPQFYVWWDNPEYAIEGPALTNITLEERQLKDRRKLSSAQIRWRRARMQRLGEKFFQEYPEDWVRCFFASGRCIFDTRQLQAVQARITAEPDPHEYSSFNLSRPDGSRGYIGLDNARFRVWREPAADRRYVIGADVGEGLADGDASCAIVLDRRTGEQVAELYGRVPPAQFGEMLNALGYYYGRAELAVERNNHGHSTLNTLLNQCRYPRLFWYHGYDARRGRGLTLGWPTTSATKPILVDDLVEAVNTGALTVHSSELVSECFTFVRDERGNAGALEGKHDDRVIAAGIAWQVRKVPEARWSSQRPPGM
jgi:hypothetical protein